mgnify:CR=1 FL=1
MALNLVQFLVQAFDSTKVLKRCLTCMAFILEPHDSLLQSHPALVDFVLHHLQSNERAILIQAVRCFGSFSGGQDDQNVQVLDPVSQRKSHLRIHLSVPGSLPADPFGPRNLGDSIGSSDGDSVCFSFESVPLPDGMSSLSMWQIAARHVVLSHSLMIHKFVRKSPGLCPILQLDSLRRRW